MKKQIAKILPLYTIVPLISAFTLNTLIYSGSMSICKNWHHYDFTSSLDRMVPVIPEWDIHLLRMLPFLGYKLYFGCARSQR